MKLFKIIDEISKQPSEIDTARINLHEFFDLEKTALEGTES